MSDTRSDQDVVGGISRRSFLGAVGAAALVAAGARADTQVNAPAAAQSDAASASSTLLSDGWMMQSSAQVKETGEQLSQAGYAPDKWYSVRLPSTVLAGLVAGGEYPDLFHGDNLKQVPKERFNVGWWYRKQFSLPAESAGRQVWLWFKGINYRANIWLNGKQIADAKRVVGTYRDFRFNVTAEARQGTNALAVEVLPPGKADLAITFVDWCPAPPDKNMGIWQDVVLQTSGPVSVTSGHVLSDLEVSSLASAKLTVMADVTNATDQPIAGTLDAFIEQIHVSQEVKLAPHETRTVTFTTDAFPQLAIQNPRVWWPWHLGKPEMYELKVSYSAGGEISDQTSTSFGIRKVTSRLSNGHRLFSVNGGDLLVLGGGYCPDLLQRRSLPGRPNWQEDQIRYVRDMNLNAIRLEGKLEDDAFYDLCDRHGILVMAGWCCCSPWEQWSHWHEEQNAVAMESLRTQIRRARTHPSMLVWLNGSDKNPPEKIERQYLAIEEELHWPCPTLSCASAVETAPSGPSGVKMEGPYKWEPPAFWYQDKAIGGAWGFNTEVGPGAVPPPLESLEQMLPPEHRWPIDAVWDFHCGAKEFSTIGDFTHALDQRFGTSSGLADFSWKAQAQAYETIRAMYEAFRRNKFDATGEIQWMLNNAWPGLIWHLYDYYLRPGAAYFATQRACEPLHVLYGYDDHSVAVVNETRQPVSNLTATAEVYDDQAKLQHRQSGAVQIGGNASVRAFTLPKIADLPATYFLRLTLDDAEHKRVSVNSYWLSTKPEVLDFDKSDWNHTPCSSFADYTLLEKLPEVKLVIEDLGSQPAEGERETKARVTNTSESIALLVRLKINKGADGEELLPIRWQDNYFMLLPGEKREISARYLAEDLGNAQPVISVDCFNNGRRSV